jgi:hypothetical protein
MALNGYPVVGASGAGKAGKGSALWCQLRISANRLDVSKSEDDFSG